MKYKINDHLNTMVLIKWNDAVQWVKTDLSPDVKRHPDILWYSAPPQRHTWLLKPPTYTADIHVVDPANYFVDQVPGRGPLRRRSLLGSPNPNRNSHGHLVFWSAAHQFSKTLLVVCGKGDVREDHHTQLFQCQRALIWNSFMMMCLSSCWSV